MARKIKAWKRVAMFSAIAMMLTANIFSAGVVYAAGENGQFDAVLPTEISRNAGEQGDYVLTVSSNMTISEDNLAAIQAELEGVYEALYGKTDEINEVIALLDVLDSKLSGFNSSISDDDWENGVAAAIEKARELRLAEVEDEVYAGDKVDYDNIYNKAYSEKIKELIEAGPYYNETKADYDDFLSSSRWAELEQIKVGHSNMFVDTEVNISIDGFKDMYNAIITAIGDVSQYTGDEEVAAKKALSLLGELNTLYPDALTHYNCLTPTTVMIEEAERYANNERQAEIAADAEEKKEELSGKIDGLVNNIYAYYDGEKSEAVEYLSSNQETMKGSIGKNKAALGVILGEIETDLRAIRSEYDVYINKSSGIVLKLAVDAEGNTGIASKDLTYRDILENNYTLDDVKINLPVALFSETGKNVTVSSVLSIEVDGESYNTDEFTAGVFNEKTYIPDVIKIEDIFSEINLNEYSDNETGFTMQMSEFVMSLVKEFNDSAVAINNAQPGSYKIELNDAAVNLPEMESGVIEIDRDEDVVTLEVVPVEVAVVDCGSQVVNAVAGVDDEAEDALTLADLEDEEPTEEPVEEEATEEETGGFSIFPWVMGGALLLIAFVLIVMYRKKSEKAE